MLAWRRPSTKVNLMARGRLAAGWMTLSLAASGVAGCDNHPGSTPQQPPPSAQAAAAPTASADCTTSPPRNPPREVTPGDSLKINVTRERSGELWDIALTEASAGQYPDLSYSGNNVQLLDLRKVYARAMAEDGYAYGTDGIEVAVSNVGGGPATINDVRLVDISRECLPSGLLVLYGNEGGDPIPVLKFDLRADVPLAYDGSQEGKVAYFSEKKISIRPGEEQYLRVDAVAGSEAYAFRIEVSYTAGGESYTRVFGRSGGGPFRVAARTCPDVDDRRELSDADIARLKSHRWKQIRARQWVASVESINSIPSETYAEVCPTY
jgi:hypothetical protein